MDSIPCVIPLPLVPSQGNLRGLTTPPLRIRVFSAMKIPTVWTWVGASSVENIMFSSQTSCHEHLPFPIEKNRSTHANSWFSPPMLGNQKLEYVKKDVNVPVTIHFSIVSPTHFERTATRKTLPLEDIEEPHPQRCSPGFTCNEHTHRIHGAIVYLPFEQHKKPMRCR